MPELRWTLAAVASLGAWSSIAAADSGAPRAADMADEAVATRSHRGVAQDYLVMPRGGELSAQMRFVTADSMIGAGRLKFTDLALFGLSARWSLFSRLELGASVELLPKQPATTDEKPWQSVGFVARSPLNQNVALQISGGGGHLLSHAGKWTRESLTIEWKKPIHAKFLAFDIQAGVSGLGLDAPNTTSTAFLTELSANTTALFREPSGHWGAWVGVGYAVPIQFSGSDPTTDLAIDPQPRLNFRIGTVLSIVPKWDLFVDVAVVDRGDAAAPETQLPILDGGFDQHQIVFGVTRHIEARKRSRHHDDDDDDAMRIGAL